MEASGSEPPLGGAGEALFHLNTSRLQLQKTMKDLKSSQPFRVFSAAMSSDENINSSSFSGGLLGRCWLKLEVVPIISSTVLFGDGALISSPETK